MSFPATYGDMLYARHVLREARRGKAPMPAPGLRDRELLAGVIRFAFDTGLVRLAAVAPSPRARGFRGRCRSCGCTDEDCSGCVERTGEPCRWIAPQLCSACGPMELTRAGVAELARLEKGLRE